MSTAKGRQTGNTKAKTGQKGKGYTVEEASLLETDATDNQWSESLDASRHEMWQVEGSVSDWDGDADWDEV
ncbi:MAG: hypothetical protein ACKPKO_37675 [Candidatus Fonsibacter sp.]